MARASCSSTSPPPCTRAGIASLAIVYPYAPLDYAALETFVRGRLPQKQPYVLLAESFSGPLGAALRADPPPANALQILQLAPDAQLVDIAGPHMLLQAAPQEAADAVATFLSGLSAAQIPA